MESIQPGSTREDLLKLFTLDGGVSTALQQTFVSRNCPEFKVNVRFSAVGRPERDSAGRTTTVEDPRDTVKSISRPYVAPSTID